MTDETMPRVLLVEDDPISRAFLITALDGVPCEVDSADGMAAALALARSQHYDAWLLDAHLADGSGIELLQRLRLLHPSTPVLAHTASHDVALHARLREAGFADVVVKPLPAAGVRGAVRTLLGMAAGGPEPSPRHATQDAPVWDNEAAALALNGNLAHVHTLRGLFLQELPHTRDEVDAAHASDDVARLVRTLHKLRASCGFVGARRLSRAVLVLEARPDLPEARTGFHAAVEATLASPTAPGGQGAMPAN
ncbi:hybrid sensor histidine kinase/response regulator [Lysobacter sp. A3-1-A15]|uniref:hybrid sensor histidine kinase/response regulator n=1 Tax=Novilysobacter viscosus TaxID=3098602 RepID=UPI002EDAF946